jgi:hypothetical protein
LQVGDDNDDFNLYPLANVAMSSNPTHLQELLTGLMLFGPISYMERGESQHSKFGIFWA